MKFRKKPVIVEAIRFTGENWRDVVKFCNKKLKICAPVEARWDWMLDGVCMRIRLSIHTLEGEMEAIPGDWIIKGVKGEFYPCKSDVFEETYDIVEDA